MRVAAFVKYVVTSHIFLRNSHCLGWEAFIHIAYFCLEAEKQTVTMLLSEKFGYLKGKVNFHGWDDSNACSSMCYIDDVG